MKIILEDALDRQSENDTNLEILHCHITELRNNIAKQGSLLDEMMLVLARYQEASVGR